MSCVLNTLYHALMLTLFSSPSIYREFIVLTHLKSFKRYLISTDHIIMMKIPIICLLLVLSLAAPFEYQKEYIKNENVKEHVLS